MAAVNHFQLLIFAYYLFTFASAYDPKPMQDFCVADFKTPLGKSVRPFPCKDPKTVTADDFFQSGLNVAGNTNNAFHAVLTPASVLTIPGLNTMGFTMARADLDVNGSFPLHYHPRATELIIILQGSCLQVGFVASEEKNYTHITKNLSTGDVFVVPVGLVHYLTNCGTGKVSAYAILNSQNPGINSVTHAVFGPKPSMNPDFLANTYQLDKKTIESLQAKDWSENV